MWTRKRCKRQDYVLASMNLIDFPDPIHLLIYMYLCIVSSFCNVLDTFPKIDRRIRKLDSEREVDEI